MTQKSKRAPVSQHPIADQVIPNPWTVYKSDVTVTQIFWQQPVYHDPAQNP